MIVEHRNYDLKYPHAIKKEKLRIVLDWLLEFRFSTMDILASRIGQSKTNANRFLNLIEKQGFALSFRNIHTNHEKYLMLSSAGMCYLEAQGRDVSRAMIRVQHMGRHSQVAHDIAVQRAVLSKLDDDYIEVIWDRNIALPEEITERPDAIMRHKKGYWVALEYERWRKDNQRIYMSFFRHVGALKKNSYSGVFYVFDQAADMKHYEKLFESDQWPRYRRDKKTGKVKPLTSTYLPDSESDLQVRDCFVFSHEPLSLQ